MAEEKQQKKTILAWEVLKNGRGISFNMIIAAILLVSCMSMILLQLFTGAFAPLDPYLQCLYILTFLLLITFILHPLGRKSWLDKPNWLFIIDAILMVLAIAVCVYISVDFDIYLFRNASPTTMDVVAGTIGVLLLLEATRRVMGQVILWLCIAFICIVLFSEHLPGFLYGPPQSWTQFIAAVWMQTFGIFGTCLQVAASYLITFMFFVGLLEVTGAGILFNNLAMSLVGRFSGGAAKVPVIGSLFFGMISGSAVANILADGPFTIPMMIKSGYRPHYASAVEATASSGGQIMPPVMGTAAFLMAEFLGFPYLTIAVCALLPALMYYACLFYSVHFEAQRMGIMGLPKEECPSVWGSILRFWVIGVPLVILVGGLAIGFSLGYAVFLAVIGAFIAMMISHNHKLDPDKIITAFERAGSDSLAVGITCAAAGIIIGCFWLTDLGNIMKQAIVVSSGGQLWLAGLWSAILCLILGMGMPTPMVYVTAYITAVPPLVALGANVLAANLFCFYYALLSAITPPVAIGAYVAAAIGNCSPFRTGFTAMKLAIVAYFAPFLFLFYPEYIAQGSSILVTILYFVTALIGLIGIAGAFHGWLIRQAKWYEIIIMVVGGACLCLAQWQLDIVGLILLLLVFWMQGGAAQNKIFAPVWLKPIRKR